MLSDAYRDLSWAVECRNQRAIIGKVRLVASVAQKEIETTCSTVSGPDVPQMKILCKECSLLSWVSLASIINYHLSSLLEENYSLQK